jgi:hypothetical protein
VGNFPVRKDYHGKKQNVSNPQNSVSKIGENKMRKIPDLIDHNTHLTYREEEILAEAVVKVVRSIFRREKNPLKLRILLNNIESCAGFIATLETAKKESNFKEKKFKELKKVAKNT